MVIAAATPSWSRREKRAVVKSARPATAPAPSPAIPKLKPTMPPALRAVRASAAAFSKAFSPAARAMASDFPAPFSRSMAAVTSAYGLRFTKRPLITSRPPMPAPMPTPSVMPAPIECPSRPIITAPTGVATADTPSPARPTAQRASAKGLAPRLARPRSLASSSASIVTGALGGAVPANPTDGGTLAGEGGMGAGCTDAEGARGESFGALLAEGGGDSGAGWARAEGESAASVPNEAISAVEKTKERALLRSVMESARSKARASAHPRESRAFGSISAEIATSRTDS